MKSALTTCARKVRHATLSGALAQLRKTHAKGLCEPYHCADCGGWHIGNPTGHDLKAQFQGARRRRAKR